MTPVCSGESRTNTRARLASKSTRSTWCHIRCAVLARRLVLFLAVACPMGAAQATETVPCELVTTPGAVAERFNTAEGPTVCLKFDTDAAGREWSFASTNISTNNGSHVIMDCDHSNVTDFYEHSFLLGFNSTWEFKNCYLFTYESMSDFPGGGNLNQLRGFMRPVQPYNGGKAYVNDSLLYWPCEAAQMILTGFDDIAQQEDIELWRLGPIVTNDGSTAVNFIDALPLGGKGPIWGYYHNLTFYCGRQRSRLATAVAAMDAAAADGAVPFRPVDGDFPVEDTTLTPPLPGPQGGKDDSTAIIIGVVVAAVAVAVLIAAFVLVRGCRRRQREDTISDAMGKSSPTGDNTDLPSSKTVSKGASLPPSGSTLTSHSDGEPRTGRLAVGMNDHFHNAHSTAPASSVFRVLPGAQSEQFFTALALATDGSAGNTIRMGDTGALEGEEGTAGRESEQTHEIRGDDNKHLDAVLGQLANAVSELRQDIGDGALTVRSVIGMGAFGLVYRGVWRGLDVAIKTVIFEGSLDSRETKSIASEAGIATSLKHDNIVLTYTHDITPLVHGSESQFYKFFLIQEYCNGGSLGTVFSQPRLLEHMRQQPQPYALELRTLLAMAEALNYLHSKRIIHADLKLTNVMLKYDEDAFASVEDALIAGRCTVKVMDFGLAQHLRDSDPHLSNFAAGTPLYVAPEVVGKGRLFLSSDVYSFGVVAWEMLTHQSIAERSQPGSSDHKNIDAGKHEKESDKRRWHRNEAFPTVPAAIPERMRALVAQCLLKDPMLRPTFNDIVREIDAVLTM